MASTQQEHTGETQTCSSKDLMFTTMKQQEADTCLEQFSWIYNQALWIQSEPDLLDNSSGQTTLCSDNQELVTTGPKDTTLKELN